MQTYLEMAQELVIDENILLQTLGMLCFTYVLSLIWFECDHVIHLNHDVHGLELFGLAQPRPFT